MITDRADHNQLDSSCGGSHNILVDVDGHNALDGLDGYLRLLCDIGIGQMRELFYITHILAPGLQIVVSCGPSSTGLPEPGTGQAFAVWFGGRVLPWFHWLPSFRYDVRVLPYNNGGAPLYIAVQSSYLRLYFYAEK